MVDNPIDGVTRQRVQPYAGARPLQQAEVSERLAAIDRTRPGGMRDHALLLVGCTFRRMEELAGLRWQDVKQRRSGVVMLTFRHCKGGKVMRDTHPPDTPLWVSYSRNGTAGQAISAQAIADILCRGSAYVRGQSFSRRVLSSKTKPTATRAAAILRNVAANPHHSQSALGA